MKVVELSGGVGGARLARGLALLPNIDLTVVVNVGDDELVHGLHVSADLDTVVYTLAGVEGPRGWGRAGDTFTANEELARFGVDNTFALGDRDLALNVHRSARLQAGDPLSTITRDVTRAFGVGASVLPATDQRLSTRLRVDEGWISFQEYFVLRQHTDEVREVQFEGADSALPAPGVLEAIETADHVLIGPSNPPLSIWPILAISEVREAVVAHPMVTAVSPLIGGEAVKGPAARVMASLGLSDGNAGVLEAYAGVIDRLFVHDRDQGETLEGDGVDILAADTLIKEPSRARRLATILLGL